MRTERTLGPVLFLYAWTSGPVLFFIRLDQWGDSESVLLIDDLDRIDPEHIFRVLNVFAAHFDRRNVLQSKNKFGFDKIILVCDIDNIRNIFKARYGADTDFNGYIDKFYSYEVFGYRIAYKNFRSFALGMFLNPSSLKSQYGQHDHANYHRNKVVDNSNFFVDILHLLLNHQQIDLRNVVKWNVLKMQIPLYVILRNGTIDVEKHPIAFFLQFLSYIKGGPIALKNALMKIDGTSLENEKRLTYIRDIVYLTTFSRHWPMPILSFNYVLRNTSFQEERTLHFAVEDTKFNFSGSIPDLTDSHLAMVISECIDFLVVHGALF